MDVLTLLATARDAGLTVEADGDRLRIRGAQSAAHIAAQLGARKAEVLAHLKVQFSNANAPTDDRSLKNSQESGLLSAQGLGFDPRHPLADFDWDTSPGFCPGHRIIRNGVEHKRADCTGRQSWRHVWGGRFCCECWPCTDTAAMVPERECPSGGDSRNWEGVAHEG